jgi:hypothetical protein
VVGAVDDGVVAGGVGGFDAAVVVAAGACVDGGLFGCGCGCGLLPFGFGLAGAVRFGVFPASFAFAARGCVVA